MWVPDDCRSLFPLWSRWRECTLFSSGFFDPGLSLNLQSLFLIYLLLTMCTERSFLLMVAELRDWTLTKFLFFWWAGDFTWCFPPSSSFAKASFCHISSQSTIWSYSFCYLSGFLPSFAGNAISDDFIFLAEKSWGIAWCSQSSFDERRRPSSGGNRRWAEVKSVNFCSLWHCYL